MSDPILARVKAVTGWTDDKLAAALGVSRALVTAYVSGRRTENLTSEQRATLLAGLRKRQAALADLVSEMEGG